MEQVMRADLAVLRGHVRGADAGDLHAGDFAVAAAAVASGIGKGKARAPPWTRKGPRGPLKPVLLSWLRSQENKWDPRASRPLAGRGQRPRLAGRQGAQWRCVVTAGARLPCCAPPRWFWAYGSPAPPPPTRCCISRRVPASWCIPTNWWRRCAPNRWPPRPPTPSRRSTQRWPARWRWPARRPG